MEQQKAEIIISKFSNKWWHLSGIISLFALLFFINYYNTVVSFDAIYSPGEFYYEKIYGSILLFSFFGFIWLNNFVGFTKRFFIYGLITILILFLWISFMAFYMISLISLVVLIDFLLSIIKRVIEKIFGGTSPQELKVQEFDNTKSSFIRLRWIIGSLLILTGLYCLIMDSFLGVLLIGKLLKINVTLSFTTFPLGGLEFLGLITLPIGMVLVRSHKKTGK